MVTVGVLRAGSASGQLLFLSSVTSIPMGGEAPEDILNAIEETEQGAMLEGQPLTTGGGSPTGGGRRP
jgi:hypothetical protein